ncbi:MAG: 16S rRNA (guanine(527)-N(7))-methyltransferase RsmG [Solirubrobacteraceae bacterium]
MPAEQDLAALAARHGLATPAPRQLEALLALLTEDPLAPTTIDAAHAVDDHLADSLVALELPEVRSATTIADLGSGAGLPGLPLAIALPHARVHLVESSMRKCAFLDRAVRECDLGNVEVVHARIEEWTGSVELVAARALAPLEVVVEYAAPLLRVGGTLVVWRGHRDLESEAAAAKAAEIVGFKVGDIRAVHPYPAARNRHLHLMSKVMETPSRFPRRPGLAMKRPLGSGTGLI